MKAHTALACLTLTLLANGAFGQAGAKTEVSPVQEKPKKTTGERAQDTADKVKSNSEKMEKAEDALKDLIGKVTKAAENAGEKAEDKGKELWATAKENLKMTREDYMKKATSGIATMDAEIQELAENGGAVVGRDYFKPRLDALKLQLDYCKRDLDRLKDLPTEEAFRVKQKSFDRTLGFLGDNVELAKEEAGL